MIACHPWKDEGALQVAEVTALKGGKTQRNARLIALAPELLAFVQDYFDVADCGNGGEHEEDMSHGRCWHCTARRLVGLLTPEANQ